MITPEIGKVYRLKHIYRATFLYEGVTFDGRKRFVFRNHFSGREIRLKSRVKILREVLPTELN